MRIASVPESHVYVRHLSHPGGLDPVVRLQDPAPSDGRKVPGGWWPPVMLEPGWVTDNHRRFDVFHVHFGFDSTSPQQLAEVMQELKMHDKPMLYTVHDLRNPHQRESSPHAEQQEVLIAAAHALITLTPGAADAVRRRWDRDAHVLPHPHVLDSARIERPRGRSRHFVVGVHAKSLRANMDPLALLDTLSAAVAELPDAILQIDLHDELFAPGNHWYDPTTGEALQAYGRHEHVRVRTHPYFSDSELWDYLGGLSVSVLPYRFGTHSGWLEACHDLGTAVIVPSCGFYDQQRPCEVFDFTEDSFDADSLRAAVRQTYRRWEAGSPAPRASWAERRAERAELSRAHAQLYREAVA